MPSITLAVVPSATPGDHRAALDELCGALSTQLGYRVRGMTPESYSELISQLERDRVQYAWMSPALVVLAAEKQRLEPLLSAVREDRTDYRSVLFVADEAPFQRIDDLHGKKVAWVDAASASGYLVPRLHLAAKGIAPARLFGDELFLRSHAEVVRAVYDGRADIGATYAHRPAQGRPIRRAGFIDVAPDRPARVLEWTQAIPSDVIAGHGLLSRTQHRAFAAAIGALAEREDGRALLYRAFHAERFTPTPRDALRPLWQMVRLARTHGLLHHL
ncbi:MAG: phosphate/phosphite/phosphonate ABC transporter substrate-binding protein [Acidobacteriota bacterium]